jgi:hypothetical protein
MLAVDATGLEVLVFALGRTLPVITFVIAATDIIAELALLAPAMLTTMVATNAGWREGVSYAHIVPPASSVACALLPPKSFYLTVHQASILFTSLVNQLKILHNGLKRLVA